jgi:drug/metabolite transporter (DMT)-like permease
MSASLFALLLLGAALHASWNAMIKAASSAWYGTVLVAGFASLLAMCALPWLPAPAVASWPYIAASVAMQVLYLWLIAHSYRVADMGLVYPLMRGTAPLLVALCNAAVFGESLGWMAVAGIAVLCTGILSMACSMKRGPRHGVLPALLNAVVIAAYTLVDGVGVRLSAAPASYTLWIFLLCGLPLPLWAWLRQPAALCAALRCDWWRGLLGGVGTIASYGIALWAMLHAPVAVVAALRETSILFAMLLARLLLGERPGRRRVLAALVMAAGVMLLRLA